MVFLFYRPYLGYNLRRFGIDRFQGTQLYPVRANDMDGIFRPEKDFSGETSSALCFPGDDDDLEYQNIFLLL